MKSIKDVYKIGSGPSSSHTMGPENAAKLFKQTYPDVKNVVVELYGSLALTGKGHLTDYIILKTLDMDDVRVEWKFKESFEEHENAMKLIGELPDGEEVVFTVFSIGGGDIVVKELENTTENLDVYPHNSLNEIKMFCHEHNLTLVEYIKRFDSEVYSHLSKVYNVMMDAVDRGLMRTGVLPGELHVNRNAKLLHEDEKSIGNLSAYAYAVNEENASGGTIVTAPTCGACGILPALIYAYKKEYDLDDEKCIDAIAVAGLFGAVVKHNASISGAEAGCQAEVGTATSMAAAAASYLRGGDLEHIECAAEIAMEHQLGLTCDPVLGYVQIPCIQRNGIGAVKAHECCKLSEKLAGSQKVNFDMIVDVMYQTGKDLNVDYRETARGGLAKFYIQDN